MGIAMYIVLDNGEPGFSTSVSGKALARESEALDSIAQELGLRPLSEFVGMSAEDALGLLGDDAADLPSIEEKWFTAEEGVTVLRALAKHVEANRTSLAHADDVLGDLSEFAAVLVKAKEIGARWHLAYDI